MTRTERTKMAIDTLGRAKAYLEFMNKENSNISGNGKDSMLECLSRIATSEPDNNYYPVASAQIYALSYSLREMAADMRDVIDFINNTARHFGALDDETGTWFHQNNPVAKQHYEAEMASAIAS